MIANIPLCNYIFQVETINEKIYNNIKLSFKTITTKKKPIFKTKIKISKNVNRFTFKIKNENLVYCYLSHKFDKSLFRDFSFFLKSIIQLLVFNKEIFLLHASSVKIGKEAMIFCGPSGSGKSTIISFFNKNDVFADDCVVIKKNKNNFYVYSSPFDYAKIPYDRTKKIKLAKIFFIKKFKKNSIKKISRFITIKKILKSNYFYLYLKLLTFHRNNLKINDLLKVLYYYAKKLSYNIKSNYLYFKKNKNFIKIITKNNN